MSEEKELPAVSLNSTVSKNVNSRSDTGRWSWETKQDVCLKYQVLGNISLVASLTGVEYHTISAWKKTEWWKELSDAYKAEQALKLDSNISRVVEKAIDIVEDRLVNGEQVLNNKTGELMVKPVSMKDASRVAADLLTRQNVIRKEQHETGERKETMKETLSMLAKEFAKWAKKDALRAENDDATDLPFIEQGED